MTGRTPHTLRILFSTTLAVLIAGCPTVPPTTLETGTLVVETAPLEFTATDAAQRIEIGAEGTDVEWTASTNQPWLQIDATGGVGAGQINVTVDRSLLDPSVVGVGIVRIRSGDQFITIPVNAVSAFTPVNTAYFPMAVGNSWTYGFNGLPTVLTKALPKAFKQESFSTSGLTLTVADQFTENDFEVWQVDVVIEDITLAARTVKGVALPTMGGGEMKLSTYWVFVEGMWYVETDRDNLALLPETDTMLSLARLLELPGTLTYAHESGLIEAASLELTEVYQAAQNTSMLNREALLDHLYEGYFVSPVALFALANSFGATFDEYDHSTPFANASVRFFADLAASLEGFHTFYQTHLEIQANQHNALYGGNLPPGADLEYWRNWSAAFEDYSNENPKVTQMIRLISQFAGELVALTDATDQYEDADLQALAHFQSYLLILLPDNFLAGATDPETLIQRLRTFVETYETENAYVQEWMAATLRILTTMDDTRLVYEASPFFPINLAGWQQFVTDAMVFNMNYQTDNGDTAGVLRATIWVNTLDQYLTAAESIVPSLNTLAEDYEVLVEAAKDTGTIDRHLDAAETVLTDFAEFFGVYRVIHEDPLAWELEIWTQAGADTAAIASGVLDDAANAPFEDVAGPLVNLLPNAPIPYTLRSFGIGPQQDCISPRVIVETEEETFRIASTIYARDIGPVLLAFLPLQYAVIDGNNIGTPPLTAPGQAGAQRAGAPIPLPWLPRSIADPIGEGCPADHDHRKDAR